jgi:uncharacterized protein YhaN
METKIIIFLAFTSVTLVFNSVIIWYAYKAFANMTTAMTKAVWEAQASESTRAWLKTLESASSQAVTLTDAAKTHLTKFEAVLARAQAKYEFKLAEIDVQMEKSIATVVRETQKMEHALTSPAHRFGATLSGVQEVIHYLSGAPEPDQTAGDASSTPKR